MLILPFKIASETYCLNIENIKEIIPVVEFKPLPESKDYFKGLINYRGSVCPVIDISLLISGIESQMFLSTRIIIIEIENSNECFGIMGEKITETLYVENHELMDLPNGLTFAKYIESTIIKDSKIMKLINPKKLFFG